MTFELGATLLRVCEHCGTAVARRGADLASYGKVAALIPTPSVLKLGLEGDYEGAPPFRLAARLFSTAFQQLEAERLNGV